MVLMGGFWRRSGKAFDAGINPSVVCRSVVSQFRRCSALSEDLGAATRFTCDFWRNISWWRPAGWLASVTGRCYRLDGLLSTFSPAVMVNRPHHVVTSRYALAGQRIALLAPMCSALWRPQTTPVAWSPQRWCASIYLVIIKKQDVSRKNTVYD